jgi:hypothetical protein
MIVSVQSEFPLRVAVCAWCKPKNRGVELGASLGAISHGICPRHFKKLTEQVSKDTEQQALPIATRSQRRRVAFNHPELNYPG